MLIRERDLNRLGIEHEEGPTVELGGEPYRLLDEIPGLRYAIDWQTTTLHIDCRAECYETHTLSGRSRSAPLETSSGTAGWFVNYDLLASVVESQARVGGFADVNLYTARGTARASFLARDFGDGGEIVRLETAWTLDQPSERRVLQVGDAIARPSRWGAPFRFGGMQLATDLSLTPYFVAFPTPELIGTADLPSSVEVYVNGTRRLAEDVPQGPFTITDVPVITGRGEAQLVVTDLLGREQVTTTPYYASPELLAPGLSTFAMQGGALREHYGTRSWNYGESFASSSYRLGVTRSLTGEISAEASDRRGAAGINAAWLQPWLGVMDLSLAGSTSGRGVGGLLQHGYEWVSRSFSLRFDQRLATEHFTQLGRDIDRQPPSQSLSVGGGAYFGQWGSTTATYTLADERDGSDTKIVGATHSIQLVGRSTLSLIGFHVLRPDQSTSIGLRLTLPLGARTTASGAVGLSDRRLESSLRVQRNPPPAGGAGYRLLLAQGGSNRGEAALRYDSQAAEMEAGIARVDDTNAARFGIRGAALVTDHGAYLSRPIDDSFAIVDAGYPGIEVLREHQPIGRTDASGRILVPGLGAYEANRIAIRPEDLPLETTIGRTEIEVVPARRSGVVAAFGATSARAALLDVIGPDGLPLPTGSWLRVDGQDQAFPVGENGRAYVTGLHSGSRLTARSGKQSCSFTVDREPPAGALPRMGTFHCARDPS